VLFDEIKGRIEETDISVPTLHYDWWYFERTREGPTIRSSLECTPHPAI